MKSKNLLLICFILYSAISFAQDKIKTREVPIPYYPPLTEVEYITIEPDIAGKGMTGASVSSGYTSPAGSAETGSISQTVNLYTGAPEITIPIYSLSEGSLSVPIYLQYNVALIKPHNVASWTGLGFELKGIPVINRVVRGFPDEGYLVNGIGRKGYYFWGKTLGPSNPGYGFDADYLDQDREPDYFFVETPSGSGRLVFDRYKNAHFSGNPDVKVEVDHIDNPHETGSNHFAKKFTSFILTFPDGIKYTFDAQNNESSAEVEVEKAQSENIYPGGSGLSNFLKYNLLPHSWYCSKIENQFGQEIVFEYERVTYSYYKTGEQTGEEFCPGGYDMAKKINRVFVRSSQIKEIKSSNLKIRFNSANSSCSTDISVSPAETVCTNSSAPREDLAAWDNNVFSYHYGQRLNEIEISDNESFATKKLKYIFTYSYLNGTEAGLPSDYDYTDIGYSHQKRLILNSLITPQAETLYFNYEGQNDSLPSRLTYGIDHWGWANGQEDNLYNIHGLIGSQTYMDHPVIGNNGCGSNRESNYDDALKGVLMQIESSLGTQTNFEYEAHDVPNTSEEVGGFRIKTVISEDLVNNTGIKKSYQYILSDNSSSGVSFLEPRYRVIFDQSGIDVFAHSNLFASLLTESLRPEAAYSRVVEKTTDINTNLQLGKVITEFNFDPTPGSTIGVDQGSCDYCYDNPVYFNLLPDNTQGSIKKLEVYNQSNRLISQSEFEYALVKYDSTLAYRTFRTPYSLYGTFRWQAKDYYFPFYKYRLKSQTQSQYSPEGAILSSTNTVNFTYKDEMPQAYREKYKGVHNMPVLISSADEEENVITNRILYIPDFSFDLDTLIICPSDDSCILDKTKECPRIDCQSYDISALPPPASTEARGIFEALEKNLIQIPIESETTINDNTIAAQYLKLTHEGVFNLGLPKTTYQLNNIPKNNFEGVYYDQPNEVIVKDSDYQPISEVLSYNNAGLPEQTKIFKGSTHKVNYLNPTVPKGSTSNYGKSDALTQSSEYGKVYLGANKLISPNSLEQRFDINSSTGRVKTEKDKNDRVLTRYDYLPDNEPGIIIPFGWESHGSTKGPPGDCYYHLKVKGLSPGGIAQFSFEGGNGFSNANFPPDQMQYWLPRWPPTMTFYAYDSNHPEHVISVTLNVCEP